MTKSGAFPNEEWTLDSFCEMVDPQGSRIHFKFEISKSRYDLDPADMELLKQTLKNCIKSDKFAFYIDHEGLFQDRSRITQERDEWKGKYEELKAHVDFMKELYSGKETKE